MSVVLESWAVLGYLDDSTPAAAATAQARGAERWTGDPELLVSGAPWAWRDLR